jgi:hypothetical protein
MQVRGKAGGAPMSRNTFRTKVWLPALERADGKRRSSRPRLRVEEEANREFRCKSGG